MSTAGWANQLARQAIRDLRPYASARSLETGEMLFLDANENPFDPSGQGLNRYPDPQPAALVRALAELYGVRPEQLFVGRGADEAIDVLVRVFCEAGEDAIVVCPPTYGVYAVCAGIQGAAVRSVPLLQRDGKFLLEMAGIGAAMDGGAKLLFVCSPNNPTGHMTARSELLELCERAQERCLVVVDEAYVEFATGPDAVSLLDEQPNLVVLRTLSKAWGLAGARCGVALAHPEVIGLMHKVRAPYPLSRPATEAVLRALANGGTRVVADVAALRRERDGLAAALARLPRVLHVYPSEANFLLMEVDDPRALAKACRERGVVVRDRSDEWPGGVRISVGSPEENRRLLAVVTEVMG